VEKPRPAMASMPMVKAKKMIAKSTSVHLRFFSTFSQVHASLMRREGGSEEEGRAIREGPAGVEKSWAC